MPLSNIQTGFTLSRRLRLIGLCLAAVLIVISVLISWGQRKVASAILTNLMKTAQEMDIGLGLGDVAVKLFRLQPSVKLTGLSLGTSEQELALHSTDVSVTVAWSSLLRDTVQISQLSIGKASLGVRVDSSGNSNWDELLNRLLSMPSNETQNQPFDQLLINNVELKYDNEQLDHEGLILVNGKLDLVNTQTSSTLEITGDLNNYLLQAALKLGGEDFRYSSGDSDDPALAEFDQILPKGLPVNVKATLAEVEFVMDARVKNTLTPPDIVGKLSFTGRNTTQLLRDLKLINTNVSELTGGLDFAISDGQYQIAGARLELGASDISGSLVLNTKKHPRIISGQLTSNRIALDELLGTGRQSFDAQGTQDASNTGSRERMFSSHPFKPVAWFSNLQGSVSGNFNSITRGAMQIDDLIINSSFDNNTASFDLNSEQFAGGSLELNTNIAAMSDGQIGTRSSKVSLKMQQVQLLDMLSLSGVSSSAGRGKISGEGTFWLEGFSPSSMAASVDGGLFTIIEEGELDSMLVEMAGADLMESISLLIKRDLQQTAIRCGFFDMQASSGVIEIKDFIIDTDDSFFLAKGYADLNNESISIKFEPHPRDASLLAAPTALVVSGSLMSPSMKPGRSLYSRIAVAGALAALAGPAAIVLPFIEVGRGGDPSSCTSLFTRN